MTIDLEKAKVALAGFNREKQEQQERIISAVKAKKKLEKVHHH